MNIDELLSQSQPCPVCCGAKSVRRGEWEAFDRWTAATKLGDKMGAESVRGGFRLGEDGKPTVPESATCAHCEGTGTVAMPLNAYEVRRVLLSQRSKIEALTARIQALEIAAKAVPRG